ncbi:MAG: 2-hydroxyacid dehydrogenase [Alphaproteobacteria bacterium]|nr:2-hydroxyacid dehydrogenase [Alphaproteobacteria bacterium]
MTRTQPVIFVGRDYILDSNFDELADALAGDGYEVIRGWGAKPPTHTEYSPDEWPELFGRAQVIVVSWRTKCPPSLLDAAPRLRGLVFPTIGTDSVDLESANERGIVVAHGAFPENFEGIAEATTMLIAALFLDLPGKRAGFRNLAPRPMPSDLKARMVQGKTIGLIGLGRIARGVVRRLAGWNVEIIAYDPYIAGDTVPDGVRMVDLHDLLRQSDAVSVHVAMTSETRAMIGAHELSLMKPSSYLINTARGAAIDEDALVDALANKRIAGAAIDVFVQEPLPHDHRLRKFDNAILTQHIIGHTRELFDAIVPTARENIRCILVGEEPLYTRNPEVLPAWRKRLLSILKEGA